MRRGPRIRGCRGLAGLSDEHCSVQATGRIWQDDWGRLTPDGRVSGRMRRRSIASIRWNSCGSYTPSFLVGEGQIGCGFVVQRLELGPRSSDHSIGTVRVVAGSLKTEAL
jgi:hypothetical protein